MHTLKFLLNTIQRTNKAQSLREKLVIKNTRKMFYLTRSSVLLVMSSPLLEHKLLAPGCECDPWQGWDGMGFGEFVEPPASYPQQIMGHTRASTLAATWLALSRHSLLVQFNLVTIVFFIGKTFIIEKDVLHQEPGGLVNVDVVLQWAKLNVKGIAHPKIVPNYDFLLYELSCSWTVFEHTMKVKWVQTSTEQTLSVLTKK